MKIFTMEKELRLIKNTGYFPVPQITPQDNKIKTTRDKDKILGIIDEIATAMLNAVKQSEEVYIREQEQARVRDEQLRSVRQTDRSDQISTTSHWLTAPQSEMTTQDQNHQGYTSTQTQFITFTPLHPMVMTNMSHL